MKRPCRHSFREVLNLVEIFYVSFSSKDFTTFSGPVKRFATRTQPYFFGSPNTVIVGFPPTISGIVSWRITPPSPEVTATY
jgi:hypothetical protein